MKQEQEEMINEIAELGDSFKQMEKSIIKKAKSKKQRAKFFAARKYFNNADNLYKKGGNWSKQFQVKNSQPGNHKTNTARITSRDYCSNIKVE